MINTKTETDEKKNDPFGLLTLKTLLRQRLKKFKIFFVKIKYEA